MMRSAAMFAMVMMAAGHAPVAGAALCKYVDESGNVTYSDSTVKGAQKSQCFEPPPVPVAPPPAPAAKPAPAGTPAPAPAAAKPSPPGFPSVSGDEQRSRDDRRRKLLQDELAKEEKLLVEARKDLAEGREVRLGSERNYQRYLDRIQKLEEAVAAHERNVAAIRKELSNLR